jgi:hypothetical protein
MIYRGSTADGSDMEVVQGMYVNPDNPDEWSNKPYKTTSTPEERQLQRTYDEVLTYMSDRYTLDDVYQQIINKTIKKSKRFRDFVLSHYDSDGNFKY